MFSKEEAKRIRQEFWITFGKRTLSLLTSDGNKKKWILFKTGISDFSFKFESERKFARVCIDIEHKDIVKRIQYWNKIESLKVLLENEVPSSIIWDNTFYLENGKEIARIYCQLDGVSLYNQKKWPEIFDFFIENMLSFEKVFIEFEDFIKDV